MTTRWRPQPHLRPGLAAALLTAIACGVALIAAPAPRSVAAAPGSGLAAGSATAEATAALLPDRFLPYETKHYVLYSDASSRWTRTQTDLLERTHHQFHRFCRRLGLEPQPLQHKLVAVVFARREAYQAFARVHDGVTDPQLSGYYAPASDRFVFYDVESNPSLAAARTRLDELQDQVRDLDRKAQALLREGRTEQAAQLRDAHRRYHRHLARQRESVEDFSRDTGTATIVHEAVHQLLFHTGIQDPGVQYPLWICEGLATAFETDRPKSAYGPDQDYDERRRRFRELADAGTLLPLRRLVTITAMDGLDDVETDAVYNQGYALVTWMARFRTDELRAYLEAMQALSSPRPSVERHLELFEQAFGDVTTLERAWRAAERP